MCNVIAERLTLFNPDSIFPVENKRSRLLPRHGIYLSRENDTKVMVKKTEINNLWKIEGSCLWKKTIFSKNYQWEQRVIFNTYAEILQ